MYIDLNCGQCESSLILDSEDDGAVWLLTHRFINAHTECGFVLPSINLTENSEVLKRRPIKPRRERDEE